MKNLNVLVDKYTIKGFLNGNNDLIWAFHKTQNICYVFSETDLSSARIVARFRLIPKKE